MRNILAVKLQGGLGNIMFQIAFGESIGFKHGFDVCYVNVDENIKHLSSLKRSPYAFDYPSIFPAVKLRRSINSNFKMVNIPFHFVDITPRPGVCYNGYFQSEKYFLNRNFIEDLFCFRLDIIKYSYQKIDPFSCFIHVRRGDYLDKPDYHPVLPMNYYNIAISMMKSWGVDKFYVFSDDIEWCKQNFTDGSFIFIQDKDYNELCMMSLCRYAIIANSSFSWWGAWLGDKDVVIAPGIWLGSAARQNDSDVLPSGWIKLYWTKDEGRSNNLS